MKRVFILILTLMVKLNTAEAQSFKVDTLQFKGDIDKYINIVIMGDGYTSSQQNTFRTDAANLSTYLMGQVPWSNYRNYFNVFAIEVISAETGAKHPGTASDCNSANPQVPVSSPGRRANIHELAAPMTADS